MNIQEISENQRRFFLSGKTLDIDFRLRQLGKLKKLIKANEQKMYDAIYADFGKSAFETYETELAVLYGELNSLIKHIRRWSKPQRVRTNLANMPGRSYILHEPYGVALVIGAWNYPYELSLAPLAVALAAGNTVVLKPSEISSHSAHLMAEIINGSFPDSLLCVVEGGVKETQELLQQRWDKIFFTGSPQVGKIVYQAAARHLTPVTLELGGKSPAIICRDASIKMAAKRVVWGKFLNGGQTCIAPDYVLVHRTQCQAFLDYAVKEIQQNYGEDPLHSEAYTRIVNERNLDRLRMLMESSSVYYGGELRNEECYLSPTLLYPAKRSEAVMQQEIFGPLLPVIEYDDLEQEIHLLKREEKPLALYLFTRSSEVKKKILARLSFGGGAINDTIFHFVNPHLPFGGVGNSGIGAYHHYEGFKAFSHSKSIVEKTNWFEPFMKYPPYTPLKKKLIQWFVE